MVVESKDVHGMRCMFVCAHAKMGTAGTFEHSAQLWGWPGICGISTVSEMEVTEVKWVEYILWSSHGGLHVYEYEENNQKSMLK